MLVLTRKPGEKILIGDDIVITVLDSRGDNVRIGIDAPRGVKIQRDEVVRAVSDANLAASRTDTTAEDRIKRSLGVLAARQSAPSLQQTPLQPAADTATGSEPDQPQPPAPS